MAFVRSAPEVQDPDLQLHFTPVGYKLTPEELIVLDEPVVTAIPNVNRPKSRGRLCLSGPDHRTHPRIFPRLLDHEDDLNVLRQGGRIIRQIFATEPLAAHIGGELAPGPEVGGTGARKVVARYPAGAQVMVFYNPQNPSEAVLERKAPAQWLMWLLLVVFDCSLCGVVPILWFSMR